MKSISSSAPAHAFAFLLWLATLVLGAVLLGLYLLLAGTEAYSAVLLIAVACSCFAGLFSLPVLLILPVSLRWVFTAAAIQDRWARLLVVISGLFGIAAFCSCWILLRENKHITSTGIMWFSVPYLPAALLSAAGIYRPWLSAPTLPKANTTREE